MRPLKIWARDNASSPVTLRQKMTYGDSVGIANPETLNLKGQLFEHWDEAGYQKIPSLDFRGLPSNKTRQVIKDDTILATISNGNAWTIDWSTMTNILDPTIYETKDISYDALGRVLEMTLPKDMDGSGNEKILKPEYNYAGGLQKIKLYDPVTTNTEEYVSEIAYNAKGQRILVAYGNDIMQRYAYDSQNFLLKRVRSEKFTLSQSGQAHTYTYNAGTVRQDITHEYDLNGNIIQTEDASTNAGVQGNGTLIRDFTYDPLYRLLTATGREEIKVWDHANPYSHDATSYATGAETNTRSYTRTYEYDALGNILCLNHNGGSGATFNRYFNDFNNNPAQAYQTNNLLTQVHYSGTTLNYTYDSNGNQLTEGSSRFHIWDHSDQLKAFHITAGSSTSKFAQYLYDAGGNRVKKVVWKSNSDAQITVYVDGVMDHIYDYNTTTQLRSLEHMELHIMDGRSRIARRRTGTPYISDTSPKVKYNLEDHLGNACVTLKADGSLFSKEEYFPFGETSFGSFSKKRYRYVGKEKDEESGLYYYGARYYAAWTCRFVSVDPLAISFPFMAPYVYAANDPIGQFDVDGMNPSGGGGKGKKESKSEKKDSNVETSPLSPFTPSNPEDREEGTHGIEEESVETRQDPYKLFAKPRISGTSKKTIKKAAEKLFDIATESEQKRLKKEGFAVNTNGETVKLSKSKKNGKFKHKTWHKYGQKVTTVGVHTRPKSGLSKGLVVSKRAFGEFFGIAGYMNDMAKMLSGEKMPWEILPITFVADEFVDDLEKIRFQYEVPEGYKEAAYFVKTTKLRATKGWRFIFVSGEEFFLAFDGGLKFNDELLRRIMPGDLRITQDYFSPSYQSIFGVKPKFALLVDGDVLKKGEPIRPIAGFSIPLK